MHRMKCKQASAWPCGGEYHLVRLVTIALNDKSASGFSYTCLYTIIG